MPAAADFGNLEGFPNGDWKSATPKSLLSVVEDLHELFLPRARYLREKLLEDALSSGETRLPGVWVSLGNRLEDWKSLLLELSRTYFADFLSIALAHPDLVFDPVWWAHAQTHSLLGEELGAFHGAGVGSGVRLFCIRRFIKEYCDGPQKADLDHEAFNSAEHFKQWVLREDWRAPRGLWSCRKDKILLEPSQAWERVGPEKTEKLLARLAADFWLEIEGRLKNKARLARIELASSAVPQFAPNLQKSPLIEKQKDPPQSGSQKRRVNPTAACFDKFAGRLMHQAHERLKKQGRPPSKHRETPDLSFPAFMKIVKKADAWLLKRKREVPLKEVLTKRVWNKVAEHNQKLGNGEKKIATLADAAEKPKFKRMIRYRFNQAEIQYRASFVSKQS